jgi:Ni/Co efflux regulator RcnB
MGRTAILPVTLLVLALVLVQDASAEDRLDRPFSGRRGRYRHAGEEDWAQTRGPAQERRAGHKRHGQRLMRHGDWGGERGEDYRWQRGDSMGFNDWNNAERIDYWQHHLPKPPQGSEWRCHHDQYVLATVAPSLAASIVLNNS